MAISDTLSDAAGEIRSHLYDHPRMYEAFRPQIEALLSEMDRARVLLDTPPNVGPADSAYH